MSKILAFVKMVVLVVVTGSIKSNKLESSNDLTTFIKANGFVIDCDEYGRIIIHTNMIEKDGKLEQLPLPVIEETDFEYTSQKNKGPLYFSPTFID